MNIAIIPARLSSKRIKEKNIKLFLKKPIISYVIKTLKSSKIFDQVIVSTESKKIKKIVEKYGASVPYLREKKLSSDYTPTRKVIVDTITQLEKRNLKLTNICCIYATSILITKFDLINAYKTYLKNKNKYIFSACKYGHPIQRSFFLNSSNKVIPFNKKNLKRRTQDLKEAYYDAGQFYFGSKKTFIDGLNIYSSRALPIILNRNHISDIDNHDDWKDTELKFKLIQNFKN